MKIGPTALFALHLFPTDSAPFEQKRNSIRKYDLEVINCEEASPTNDSNQMKSVFEILSETKTKFGTSLLRKWLEEPLGEISSIKRRQWYIAFFIKYGSAMTSLRDDSCHLLRFPDWAYNTSKLKDYEVKKNVTLQDLLVLYRCIIRFQAISKVLEPFLNEENEMMCSTIVPPVVSNVEGSEKESTTPDNHHLFQRIRFISGHFEKYLQLVEELVDIDSIRTHSTAKVPVDNNSNDNNNNVEGVWKDSWIRVRPKYSPELNKLYEELQSLQSQMAKELQFVNSLVPNTSKGVRYSNKTCNV